MTTHKYVMFRCTKNGNGNNLKQDIPVMFSHIMVHALVAEYLKVMLRREHKYDDVEVISAGFYDDIEDKTTGESESLKIKSRPEDAVIISTFEYLHGLVA